MTGSEGTPENIDAGTGISISTSAADELIFVQGNGGAVDISANPQIGAGGFVGQILYLWGKSDTNTVKIDTGTGVDLLDSESIVLYNNSILSLIWSGTTWQLLTRTE